MNDAHRTLMRYLLFGSLFLLLIRCTPSAPTAVPLDTQGQQYLTVSQRAYQRGNFTEALAWADSALAHAPTAVEPWIHQGNLLFSLDRYAAAESTYTQALVLQPQDGGIWLNLGNTLFRQQSFDAARAAYRNATRLLDTPAPWLALAEMHQRFSQPDSARLALQTALTKDSSMAVIYTNLSKLEEAEGQLAAASHYAERAYAIDTTAATAYQLGILTLKQGDALQAEGLLQWVATEQPWNFSALFNWGQALQRLNRPDAAHPILERAAALRAQAEPVETLAANSRNVPNNFRVRLELAEAYRNLGRLPDALTTYQVAAMLRPNNLDVRHNIATLHMALGDTAQARIGYESIITADSTHVEALINLMLYHNTQGNRPKARAYLQQAYRHGGPDHPSIRRLQGT
ncbi:MAG: hypothetical protein RhofKO_37820 [Rhodothermales bacterium]